MSPKEESERNVLFYWQDVDNSIELHKEELRGPSPTDDHEDCIEKGRDAKK
jgi:hypothetical protein